VRENGRRADRKRESAEEEEEARVSPRFNEKSKMSRRTSLRGDLGMPGRQS
jgi:hypothetical protein